MYYTESMNLFFIVIVFLGLSAGFFLVLITNNFLHLYKHKKLSKIKIVLKNSFLNWIQTAFVLTLVFGFIYVMMQQHLRQSANEPLVQMAEDSAYLLAQGKFPPDINPSQTIEISHSLSPYLMFFDNNGRMQFSNATLFGANPVLPKGIFNYTAFAKQNRVTWQPLEGVRQAIVVVAYTNGDKLGFVVSGRSLREVERQVDNLGILTLFGWSFSLVIVFITRLLLWRF